MAKLHYKSLNIPTLSDLPLIVISNMENDGGDTLEISVSCDEYSFVLVDGKKKRLSHGLAEFDVKALREGASDVIFIRGTKSVPASPFFISDGKIERVPIDTYSLKILENLLLSLSQRLISAEQKIQTLEEKITQKNIFNFG